MDFKGVLENILKAPTLEHAKAMARVALEGPKRSMTPVSFRLNPYSRGNLNANNAVRTLRVALGISLEAAIGIVQSGRWHSLEPLQALEIRTLRRDLKTWGYLMVFSTRDFTKVFDRPDR